jgi:hypothetical protein
VREGVTGASVERTSLKRWIMRMSAPVSARYFVKSIST